MFVSYGLDTGLIRCDRLTLPAPYRPDGVLPVRTALAHMPGGPRAASGGVTFASPYSGATPRITPVSATYRRWLSLEAVDIHASPKVTLWKIAAIERGYLPDLARLFPIMLAACKPFIRRTTDKVVVVRIQEDDEEVRRIAGGSTQ